MVSYGRIVANGTIFIIPDIAAATEDEEREPIVIDTDRCNLIDDNMFSCETGSGEYFGGETADG